MNLQHNAQATDYAMRIAQSPLYVRQVAAEARTDREKSAILHHILQADVWAEIHEQARLPGSRVALLERIEFYRSIPLEMRDPRIWIRDA